jgi:hypothetical protein
MHGGDVRVFEQEPFAYNRRCRGESASTWRLGMTIRFAIALDIERTIRTEGSDPSREAREVYLVELYRRRTISHRQLGDALGLDRFETDGVLKKHNVGLGISIEEMRAEADALRDVRPE